MFLFRQHLNNSMINIILGYRVLQQRLSKMYPFWMLERNGKWLWYRTSSVEIVLFKPLGYKSPCPRSWKINTACSTRLVVIIYVIVTHIASWSYLTCTACRICTIYYSGGSVRHVLKEESKINVVYIRPRKEGSPNDQVHKIIKTSPHPKGLYSESIS